MQGTGTKPSFSIVAHSHLRWDFVWQRPQQIFSRLAANHHVLFVEEPVYEPSEAHLRILEIQPNLVRAIPVLPEACPVDEQCEVLLPLLERAMQRHPLLAGRFETLIQWFYSPMRAPGMLARLGEIGVVYDCMDELANFRFAPADIGQREKFLLKHADVVFTGGLTLYEAKARHHDNVHMFGCGVDVEHFAKARDPQTTVPQALAHLPRPVLGYFGVIDERLDYDLIGRLAARFEHGSIVMAGPLAKVEPSHLPQKPNIHWLGQQPYSALPALVKAYDVCLMPFALNDATRYINPTKTLEYLAAGKPIVSTPIADVVRNFGELVHVATDHEEFAGQVMRALQPDPERVSAGLARAHAATWDSTVASMRRHIVEAVHGRLSLAVA